ncbi:MAG TPA: FG-GAP-like repeat-containing protein, partial [Chitinophagaceae bacterium]
EIVPSRGFQSSMDYKVIIGLGRIAKIDSVIIRWPDLSWSRYISPPVNQVYSIDENNERRYPFSSQLQTNTPDTSAMFQRQPVQFDKHEEDDYVDFFYERNVPEMLSRLGPKAAVADVNADGLDDVVIGGTAGHPAQVYLQSATKRFVRSDQPSIAQFSDFEDNGVLVFDANHDGKPDLLLCPGGNNVSPGSRQLQLRLFLNDGAGHFNIDADAFPANEDNISVAVANDFDHDGYPDLFVGGRSVPKEYGMNPVSHLFRNDGRGHFTDVAGALAPGLSNIGMVTGAVWTDIDGDGEKELVITGEWMAPAIFHYDPHTKKFAAVEHTGLEQLFGLWQTVTADDLNGDGRPDLVFGNVGENFYLRPDSAHPVKLFVNDFDQNGVVDKILTYTVDGHDKPVFLKHDLEDAMPFLKKNNLRHAEYAKKSVQDLVPADALNKALQKTFNYCSSIIAFNEGNGKFRVSKLPDMTQLSSVNAVVSTDINGDGLPDLILGGNQFDFLPQLERLDASRGDVLINKGQGKFARMDARGSGLDVTGEVRDLAAIRVGDRRYVLFFVNDSYPAVYELN